ncbi:hypothetical protein ACHAQH_006181 [Verticillium albo-atrum]
MTNTQRCALEATPKAIEAEDKADDTMFVPVALHLARHLKANGSRRPCLTLDILLEKPWTTGWLAQASVQAATLHADPVVFPGPDAWTPERRDLPRTSPRFKEMHKNFWPFGSGPRMCIGMHVAWSKMRILTARIFSTYKTTLGEPYYTRNADGTWALRELNDDTEGDVFPATEAVFEPISLERIE